jgi:tRNA pseudouridine55 synthase
MEGILLINKPKGPTSFQIIRHLRRVTGERKIGHTGTLDPCARGLMIVLLGGATKYARHFEHMKKRYIAKLVLGVRTDTLDREGVVLFRGETGALSEAAVADTIALFTGSIMQTPPRFSAIKHRGKRAYRLARQGKEFQLEPRRVVVYGLRMIYYAHPFLKLAIECSKGTYIRALARDIGEELGSGATLHSLLRVGVGRWNLHEALSSNEMQSAGSIAQRLLPVERIFGSLTRTARSAVVDTGKGCS